jgi:transposase
MPDTAWPINGHPPDPSCAQPKWLAPDMRSSLPRSGTVRAARLVAEISDARGRFSTPEALMEVPLTRQSKQDQDRQLPVGRR